MNDPYKKYGTFKKFINAWVCFAPFSTRGELPIFIMKPCVFLDNNSSNFYINKRFLGFFINDD